MITEVKQQIEYLLNQAVTQHKEGHTAAAIDLYLKSLELDEHQLDWVYGNVITLLAQAGRVTQGLSLREKALKIHPNSNVIYRAIGLAHYQQGDFQNSINCYLKSLEIHQSQPNWVYSSLIEMLVASNQLQQAIKIGHLGMKFHSNCAWVNYHLAEAFAASEKWEEALSHYSKAAQIKSDLPNIQDKINLFVEHFQKQNKKLSENKYNNSHVQVIANQNQGQTKANSRDSQFDKLNESYSLNLNSDPKANVRLIAFYLPQFHPIPENDQWWGKGFTEWTNVTKAKPLFKDHYQPRLPADLGFYDLRIQEVREEQAKLAKQYGVHGFCYYYYWFAGKRLLHRPIDDMLNSGKPDFPFCLCWANENWTRRWDGAEHDVLIAQEHSQENDAAFAESLVPFLKDKRYIRINGKPLVLIYRVNILPDPQKSIGIWREVFRNAGIGEVNICGALTFGLSVNNMDQMSLDSAVQFPPHGVSARLIEPETLGVHDYKGNIYDFRDVVDHALSSSMPKGKKLFLSTMTGWDNTARKGKAGNVFLHANPDLYELWLRGTVEKTQQSYEKEERLVFVNAWNEWAEGTHLEPDRKNGHDYLSATCRAIYGSHSLDSSLQLLRKLSITTENHLHQLIDDLEIRIKILSRSLKAMFQLGQRLKKRYLVVSSTTNQTSNNDTISYIESPVSQQQFQKADSFVIAGWVVSKISQPNTVELCQQGKLIGSAFVNFPRPDVFEAYRDFNSENSGFHLVYKVHKISEYPLEIYLVLENGTRYLLGSIHFNIKEDSLSIPVKIRKSLKWDKSHEDELSNILASLRTFPLAENYGELLDELDFILNHRKQTMAALEELIVSAKESDLF